MLEILGNPPFYTFTVLIVCILIFFLQPTVGAVCLEPHAVVSHWQLLRLFIYPFIHVQFFHILLNMIAWMFLARDFEHTIGTLPSIYTIAILFTPVNAVMQTLASLLVDTVFSSTYASTCSIGMSGVLFTLLVINLHTSGTTHTSLFGLISIPVRWYPFILIALIQLLFPNVSMLGHLSGVASGYLFTNAYFRVVIPSNNAFQSFEQRCRLTTLPAWQPVPSFFAHMLSSILDPASMPLLSRQSAAQNPNSLSRRLANTWSGVTSRFSTNSAQQPASEELVFSGQGRPLGGDVSANPTSAGRVPPASRLLQPGLNGQPHEPPNLV